MPLKVWSKKKSRGDNMDKECNICGETLVVECDVSTDDDSPIRGKQRADWFSYCPNVCRNCGEHNNENGVCAECDKEESNER